MPGKDSTRGEPEEYSLGWSESRTNSEKTYGWKEDDFNDGKTPEKSKVSGGTEQNVPAKVRKSTTLSLGNRILPHGIAQ